MTVRQQAVLQVGAVEVGEADQQAVMAGRSTKRSSRTGAVRTNQQKLHSRLRGTDDAHRIWERSEELAGARCV